MVGYYQSEISFNELNEFFKLHNIDDPCILGNVMILPKHLIDIFCETFSIVFFNKISDEMIKWCEENIKSFYSIHGDEETLSQKYILIKDKNEHLLFKLTWG
jgi:hypothetical protein